RCADQRATAQRQPPAGARRTAPDRHPPQRLGQPRGAAAYRRPDDRERQRLLRRPALPSGELTPSATAGSDSRGILTGLEGGPGAHPVSFAACAEAGTAPKLIGFFGRASWILEARCCCASANSSPGACCWLAHQPTTCSARDRKSVV